MKETRLTNILHRFDKEPQFSTSMFRSDDVTSPDQKASRGLGPQRKAMAVLGGSDSNTSPRNPPSKPRNNSTSIAPWDTSSPPSSNMVAPWDDPQAQIGGSRPFGQSYFNESSEEVGNLPAPARPGTGRTGHSESPDYNENDIRRPSVASATTVSSQGSKTSTGGSRFQKSLKSFFGDDPQSESKSSLQDYEQNGQSKVRHESVDTQNTIEAAPKAQDPIPSSDVTPWSYQEFSDV